MIVFYPIRGLVPTGILKRYPKIPVSAKNIDHPIGLVSFVANWSNDNGMVEVEFLNEEIKEWQAEHVLGKMWYVGSLGYFGSGDLYFSSMVEAIHFKMRWL